LGGNAEVTDVYSSLQAYFTVLH